mmetsp:Transcript_76815/g.197821  ORF Transcript_76815/g.197821 Transcript_76815/m.197821 type:complete len:258 (+) Transcript_76815:130-903(+)
MAAVTIKQSTRRQYEHLKYAYPETFNALVRAMESDSGNGLCQPPASRRGLSRSGTGASHASALGPDALLSMSMDELTDHLSEVACQRLTSALIDRRSRASRSGAPSRLTTGKSALGRPSTNVGTLPQVASAPDLMQRTNASAPFYRSRRSKEPVPLSEEQQGLALRKARLRNYCGRLFEAEDPTTWEPASVMRKQQATIPPPKEAPPPPTANMRLIAKEKEDTKLLRYKKKEHRQGGGGYFLGSETWDKINAVVDEG